jgi:protein SCO1
MRRVLALFLIVMHGIAWGDEPGYRQFPGALVPGEAMLADENGHAFPVERLMSGNRPALLALIYFHCPALCGAELSDLFAALGQTGLTAGQDYDLFVVSIDPKEGSRDASEARIAYLKRFPLPGAGEGWHFLTGDPEALGEIEQSVGFTARYEPMLGQYLHPAGVVVTTPKRRVSSYLLGTSYDAYELRRRLREAGDGHIAPSGNPILLLCFHFDANSGRYSLDVFDALKMAAALTILGIGGTLVLAYRRGRGS